jgi:poly(hydroxyalkanoate) depolymerase family esterase
MLRLLRRWIEEKIGSRLRYPRRLRELGRSRFLKAKFIDSRGASRPSLRREIGYRLYLPSGSSRRGSLPLIVMLHGCRQDPGSFAEGTRMNTLAEEYRCAVLYPEQSNRSNPLRCWNWFEPASLAGQGEAAAIARLIAQVTVRRPVDPRRVYMAGMSAGGAMGCLLAVRHSHLFAACAIHSGVMYGAASSAVQALVAMRSGPSAASIDRAKQLVSEADRSAVTVPTLVIHGDSDTTVNPVNADQIIEQLKARCESIDPAAGPLVASDERRSESGGRAYRQQDYSRQRLIVLRKVLVEGLGHAWSGGDPRHEFNEAAGPDASRLILDFVMQHQRETHPGG